MNVFDKIMSGDIDGLQRDYEEMRFKRMAEFTGHFRSAMAQNLRPALADYFRSGGTHEPGCGASEKGDLLRWADGRPSLRRDMLEQACAGKVIVGKGGPELLLWIATRLRGKTLSAFIALAREKNQ